MAALAAAGTVLAGCGGNAPSPLDRATTGTPLTRAMASVRDTPAARAYFEWGNLSQVRAVYRHSRKRWYEVYGLGASPLMSGPFFVGSPLGFSVTKASTAVTVGQPPHLAVRLTGPAIEAKTVAAAYKRAGASRHGRFLVLGRTAAARLTGLMPGMPNVLGRSVASGHTYATGDSAADVRTVLGGGKPLTDDPAYATASACLGNVMWALISPPFPRGRGQQPELVVIGGRPPASPSSPPVEELCVVDRSAAAARAHLARLHRTLAPHAVFLALNQAVDHMATKVAFGRVQGQGAAAARATLTLRRSAGLLLELYNQAGLAELYATTCDPRVLLGRNYVPAEAARVCRALGLHYPRS